MIREWMMVHAVSALVLMPVGILVAAAVLALAWTRKGGHTLLQAAVRLTPVFYLEGVYYAWAIESSILSALASATVAVGLCMCWAWLLDRATATPDRR